MNTASPRRPVRDETRARASGLRKEETTPEHLLWKKFRNRALAGFKFRRQYPIEPFIVDFCCPDTRLTIEIDGPTHEGREQYDSERDARLSELGYRVLRVTNADVMHNIDGVLEVIYQALTSPPHPSPLPLRGRGDSPVTTEDSQPKAAKDLTDGPGDVTSPTTSGVNQKFLIPSPPEGERVRVRGRFKAQSSPSRSDS